jgi:ribosomal protein S18 acetylase RimI-like enzyme
VRKPAVKSILGSACELRAVTEDDLDAVLDVYRQCEDFLALGPEPRASMEMVLRDIETSERERGVFYGIHGSDGKMIGVVDFVPVGFDVRPHVAFISLLMIAWPFRGRGMGEEIVRLIEEDCRANHGATAMLTSVQVNNPNALRFWHNNGYRTIGGPELRPDQTTVFHLQKNLNPSEVMLHTGDENGHPGA